MRKWNAWLLPVLTLLVALLSVLLPQRLSLLGDEAALHTVHAEALTADNNLPARPLSLEERVVLLARWSLGDDLFAAFRQPEEQAAGENEALAERVREELEDMVQSGALPADALPDTLPPLRAQRLGLWTADSFAGAEFLVVDGHEKRQYLYLVLDGESGHVLFLDLALAEQSLAPEDAAQTPEALGAAFFRRLGLAGEWKGTGGEAALFRLPDSGVTYQVYRSGPSVRIAPCGWAEEEDWQSAGNAISIG